MTNPVDILQLREQAAYELETLAREVRDGSMDVDFLDYALSQLAVLSYGKYGSRFYRLWMQLRDLKAVLRSRTASGEGMEAQAKICAGPDGTIFAGGAFSGHLTDVLRRIARVVEADGLIYEVDISALSSVDLSRHMCNDPAVLALLA